MHMYEAMVSLGKEPPTAEQLASPGEFKSPLLKAYMTMGRLARISPEVFEELVRKDFALVKKCAIEAIELIDAQIAEHKQTKRLIEKEAEANKRSLRRMQLSSAELQRIQRVDNDIETTERKKTQVINFLGDATRMTIAHRSLYTEPTKSTIQQ